MNLKLKKLVKFLAGVLAVLAILAFFSFKYSYNGRGLRVTVCDVGQGDAILVQTPGNQDILIDGGPDNLVLDCLGRHLAFNDRQLDLVILTHPHADHVVGLAAVLSRYEVKEVLMTGVLFPEPAYQEFLRLIAEKQIKVTYGLAGQNLSFGSDVSLEIIYPLVDLKGKKVENINNSSIVGRLRYQETSFLLTGDLEGDGELALLATPQDLKSTVLKVGHHGSSYSTGVEFLKSVKPELAAISVGQGNKFGHPSLRVVNRLIRAGAAVRRTDQEGEVTMVSDGERVVVR
ncbi:MAG: ComEC/Rec2 family competence protein [Patescibacteria group bacterium]|jgi:competence protein ComEC